MKPEPAYDPAIERRYPLITVDLDLAGKLVEPLPGFQRPQSMTLLSGGHINTNYILAFPDGKRAVLRCYADGETAFRKEAGLLRALRGFVPLPNLRLAAFERKLFPHPYAVLDWVDGRPLNEVVSGHPEAAGKVGEAIAATLLAIGRHTFDAYPSIPLGEYIHQCLFDGGAIRHLGKETAHRLWDLVQARSALIERLNPRDRLVHGDFQNDNILLKERGGAWEVAAVLDWEWARNGSYLRDLGTLLRFRCDTSPAFHSGLESGFARAGAPLPAEWKMAATILDMTAQCEKLTHPKHRGEVTLRTIKLIERCLNEYAS